MRACYPLRSEYDTRATISVTAAIDYGEQLLHMLNLRDGWRRSSQGRRTA